jgi:hypothetical protein
MGGATVGLADTFLAGTSNPGGLALAMGVGDTNITKNTIRDANTQDYGDLITPTQSLGAALNLYPWTFSLGVIPIGWEGQYYYLPPTAGAGFTGQSAHLVAESHEFRVAAARSFFDNRLGVGMSANIGVGEEEIQMPSQNFDDDRHAAAIGATWGATWQFPNRILLGASYTLPMHYNINTNNSPEFPGYFQSLDTPSRLEFGLGWISNRFFRGDLQLSRIGETPNAALLSNDANLVGLNNTWQPKLGAAYIFMDYRRYMGTLFTGGYLESSRIDFAGNRFHKTVGLEMKASIFTVGVGIDAAPSYQNSFYSVGIDAGIVLEILHLMPEPWQPEHQGMFPNPVAQSDAGLARPLQKDWKPKGDQFDILEVIKDFPKHSEQEVKRVEEKAKGEPTP